MLRMEERGLLHYILTSCIFTNQFPIPFSLFPFLYFTPFSNQPPSVDFTAEHRMIAEALAKKEMAQKKLAGCYFSLIMGREIERHQRASFHKWVFVRIQNRCWSEEVQLFLKLFQEALLLIPSQNTSWKPVDSRSECVLVSGEASGNI